MTGKLGDSTSEPLAVAGGRLNYIRFHVEVTKMKLGVFLPSRGSIANLDALREAALASERLGYNSVWVGDHLSYGPEHANHSPSYQKDQQDLSALSYFEGHTTLSYVAGVTERVMLGMAVLAVPCRDPRVYAKEAMTLQALSNGRLIIGCGMGDYEGDFELTGKSRKNRVSLTEEYLECLNVLLQGGEVSFQGKTVSVEKAWFYPQVDKIPLLYGGGITAVGEGNDRRLVLAEKPIERAARLCDGMMPYGPPETLAEIQARMRQIASEKYGRHPSHETIAMVSHVVVCETDEEANEAMKPYIENSAIPVGNNNGDLIGGIETAAAQLRKFSDNGINHLVLMFSVADIDEQLKMMELISKKVLPLV